MNVIMGESETGRSTFAVNISAEYKEKMGDTIRIVVPDTESIKNIMALADWLGIDIPEPITFADYISGRFKPEDQDMFIFDDLDKSLKKYSLGCQCFGAIVQNDGFKFTGVSEDGRSETDPRV